MGGGAPSGDELFYVSRRRDHARRRRAGTSWAATALTLLIKEGFFTIPDGEQRAHIRRRPRRPAVSDAQANPAQSTATALASVIVVLNWTEELKQRVPRADISSRKRMKICGLRCENGAGASGEIDRTSGEVEAGELADPERAC